LSKVKKKSKTVQSQKKEIVFCPKECSITYLFKKEREREAKVSEREKTNRNRPVAKRRYKMSVVMLGENW